MSEETLSNDLQVTPASEFRAVREKGVLIRLPMTNRVVRMRTVKPGYLIRLGKIPNPLAELVMSLIYGSMTQEKYKAFFELGERVEHARDFVESMEIVCTAALMEPVIVSDPSQPNEISIDDLEDGEQRWIFDLALLEATRLARFPEEQGAGLELVPDSQEAEPTTEQAD